MTWVGTEGPALQATESPSEDRDCWSLNGYGLQVEPPPDGRITAVIVRGQNLILVHASVAWTRQQKQASAWLLSGPYDTPRVAGVELVDADSLFLRTDMTLREQVVYTLNLTAAFSTGDAALPWTLDGKRLSVYERPRETLLDLGLEPFDDFDYTAGGDIPLRGGLATVRKVVLDTLLTPVGSLPWAPTHGSDLQHKKPRPLDLTAEARRRQQQIEDIPGVAAAEVTVTWNANYHLIASIRVRTDFGPLNERVNLTTREVIV